jgi:light-harvesting complex I chlorophyll a/b binding protein 1
MREAEVKHSRLAMLAFLGWVAVDFGVRFPGDMFASIPNSLAAHNAAVQNGSMGFLLFVVSILELCTGAAIYDQSKGSGRKSGEFSFDPLGLGKDPKSLERYSTNEIKNGRLAMLAISGIVTQAAAFPDKAFPFF